MLEKCWLQCSSSALFISIPPTINCSVVGAGNQIKLITDFIEKSYLDTKANQHTKQLYTDSPESPVNFHYPFELIQSKIA